MAYDNNMSVKVCVVCVCVCVCVCVLISQRNCPHGYVPFHTITVLQPHQSLTNVLSLLQWVKAIPRTTASICQLSQEIDTCAFLCLVWILEGFNLNKQMNGFCRQKKIMHCKHTERNWLAYMAFEICGFMIKHAIHKAAHQHPISELWNI